MPNKPSRSRSPTRPPRKSVSPKRGKSPGPDHSASRKSPRISRKSGNASSVPPEIFLSLDMSSSKHSKTKKSPTSPLRKDLLLSVRDMLDSFIFLSSVLFGGQFVRFCGFVLPIQNFEAWKFPLIVVWVFVTCFLCCYHLPPGSFNPWSTFDSKFTFQRKAIRIFLQLLTAVVFSIVICISDKSFKTGFDREFLAPRCDSSNFSTSLQEGKPCLRILPVFGKNGTTGAILNEFLHTFAFNLAVNFLTPRIAAASSRNAARVRSASCLTISTLLIVIILSPWSKTGPTLNPSVATAWAAMLFFDSWLRGTGGLPSSFWMLYLSLMVGTLGGVVVALWARAKLERAWAAVWRWAWTAD